MVAEKIGMSGRSYDKGRKVMERIEDEKDPELKEFMVEVFNENINGAAKLIEKPYGFIKEVKDRTYIDFKMSGRKSTSWNKKKLFPKQIFYPGNIKSSIVT